VHPRGIRIAAGAEGGIAALRLSVGGAGEEPGEERGSDQRAHRRRGARAAGGGAAALKPTGMLP
jgi:hypothetical protein